LKLTSASGNNSTGIMDFTEFSPAHQNQFFDIQSSGPAQRHFTGHGPKHFDAYNHVPIAEDVQLHGLRCGFEYRFSDRCGKQSCQRHRGFDCPTTLRN